jgi:hypothetical protein
MWVWVCARMRASVCNFAHAHVCVGVHVRDFVCTRVREQRDCVHWVCCVRTRMCVNVSVCGTFQFG